jgi:PKD repeat protein
VGSNSIVSPEINPGETLSNGFIGRAYDDTVKLSAGTLPVVFTVDASTLLPSGLTLNASTGRITGTPTATCEDHEVKIKAQNPGGSDEKEFTFTIRQIVPPVITTPAAGAIANGYLSIPYSLTFELQSGTGKPTVKFYLTTGSVLPAGLTLEPNGQLHGTPTSVETQNFTICAETEGEYDYRSYTISILVAPSNPDFLILPEFSPSNGETLPQAKENMPYTELAVQITGSQYMDVQYDPSTFPTGMTFDPYARKILGTPIQGTAGEYHLHLWAKNPATKPASSTGPDSVGVLYELVVQPAAVPLITTQSLPAAAQGEPYSADIETDDAGAALQLQGGILPSGVTFTPAAPAVVAGTPASPGTYTFKVKASNAEGSSSKDFTLTVQPAMPPPVIDPFTLPEGTAGEAYTGVTLTAVNSPTTWSWTGAPPGLVLGNSGTVSGIPTAYGVYNVTFTASNAWGSGASVSASVVIRQSPLSVPPTLVSAVSEAVEGQAYRAEVFLFNRSDIVWTLESGSLPFGLTFEDGVISGTPLGEGKYVITVKASSAGGHFTPVTKELTIWIMSFREEYRSREVALPSIAGMTTDLEPNVYYVKSGDDFSFVLTPHDAGVTPEVTTNRLLKPDSTGVSVTPNSDGVSYTVVIRDIREDVLINAVPSATAPVESAAKVVWSEKGRLFLSVTATAEARIRNVTGQLVKTVSVEPFRTAVVALPAGLYIVELNSGTVYKVLIH